MTVLTLRPMTDDELAAYAKTQEDGYARQMVDFGGMTEAEAVAKASADMERYWPSGRPAEGHHVFAAEVDGEVVGHLWLSGNSPNNDVAGQGWIYDVEVDPAYRGRGLGRELMQAALDQARTLGCTSLALNVFGGNDVAIRLYQSLGFRTTHMQMSKAL
ncbi:MAG: GNAT family N-acetyltransferase [Jiangellaceae bacterium]